MATVTKTKRWYVRARQWVIPVVVGLVVGWWLFTPSQTGGRNNLADLSNLGSGLKRTVQEKAAALKMTVEQQGVKARELFSAEISSAPAGVEYKGHTVTTGRDVAPRSNCEALHQKSADGIGYVLWKCRRQ